MKPVHPISTAIGTVIGMNSIWKESFPVRSFDVGNAGVLKPQTIFQFFQEAAGIHATHLGVGFDALRKLGLFWVLSRVKVGIERLPAWGDEVTLVTWPKGIDRLFALRDFRMLDRDGATMVRGTSCWLLVDIERMRPRRIDSIPRSFPVLEQEHALRESLDKISAPETLAVKYEKQVTVSDLDVNHHVNNTEYVRWIADCLEPGEGTLRSLQVNYLEEAKLGDTLVFSLGQVADATGTLYVEGTNRASRTTVVQGRIELQP